MPWYYKNLRYWQHISNRLTGKRFYGKVHEIIGTQKPYRVIVNARDHKFKPKALVVDHTYDTVIVQKSKYGLFVDAGFHFDWQFGSFLGLLHISVMWKKNDYKKAEEGQIISTFFRGYTKDGKLIFGRPDIPVELDREELKKFIGTRQKVTVKINDQERTEFFVNNTYRAKFPVTRRYYPNDQKRIVKSFKEQLKNGEEFEAEIISIHTKRHFVVVLPKEDPCI